MLSGKHWRAATAVVVLVGIAIAAVIVAAIEATAASNRRVAVAAVGDALATPIVWQSGDGSVCFYNFYGIACRDGQATAAPITVTPTTISPTAAPITVTPTPAATLSPSPSPSPSPTSGATVGAAIVDGGFETVAGGLPVWWAVYPLSPEVVANVEDANAGARLVEAGRYALRLSRESFAASPPILRAGIMGTIRDLSPGQAIRVACRVWGVYWSRSPYSSIVDGIEYGNRIGSIYSSARIGLAAWPNVSADPGVVAADPRVLWRATAPGDGLSIGWKEITGEGIASTAATARILVEVQIGSDWSAYPWASAHIDSCRMK